MKNRYKINKKITDQKEKVDALQEFLFKQIFSYKIKDKIITFTVPKEAEQFIKEVRTMCGKVTCGDA